jgi:hypothetical protein
MVAPAAVVAAARKSRRVVLIRWLLFSGLLRRFPS